MKSTAHDIKSLFLEVMSRFNVDHLEGKTAIMYTIEVILPLAETKNRDGNFEYMSGGKKAPDIPFIKEPL